MLIGVAVTISTLESGVKGTRYVCKHLELGIGVVVGGKTFRSMWADSGEVVAFAVQEVTTDAVAASGHEVCDIRDGQE